MFARGHFVWDPARFLFFFQSGVIFFEILTKFLIFFAHSELFFLSKFHQNPKNFGRFAPQRAQNPKFSGRFAPKCSAGVIFPKPYQKSQNFGRFAPKCSAGVIFSEILPKNPKFSGASRPNPGSFSKNPIKILTIFRRFALWQILVFFNHPGSLFFKFLSKVLSGVIIFEKYFKSLGAGSLFLIFFLKVAIFSTPGSFRGGFWFELPGIMPLKTTDPPQKKRRKTTLNQCKDLFMRHQWKF